MADIVSRQKRSQMMSEIRSKDTKPEMIVRSMLHRMRLRFRLHRADLPGTPDLVFPKYDLAVFIHGCFWHRHKNCQFAYNPKTRHDFWSEKFSSNMDRDRRNQRCLRALGWKVFIVWECETKNLIRLQGRLNRFFS